MMMKLSNPLLAMAALLFLAVGNAEKLRGGRALNGPSNVYLGQGGTVDTPPPDGGLWEKKPCMPFSAASPEQINDVFGNGDETCQDNDCSGGCCRAYHWLLCDTDNAFPFVPCFCNENTRDPASFGTPAPQNEFIFTDAPKPETAAPVIPTVPPETTTPPTDPVQLPELRPTDWMTEPTEIMHNNNNNNNNMTDLYNMTANMTDAMTVDDEPDLVDTSTEILPEGDYGQPGDETVAEEEDVATTVEEFNEGDLTYGVETEDLNVDVEVQDAAARGGLFD